MSEAWLGLAVGFAFGTCFGMVVAAFAAWRVGRALVRLGRSLRDRRRSAVE